MIVNINVSPRQANQCCHSILRTAFLFLLWENAFQNKTQCLNAMRLITKSLKKKDNANKKKNFSTAEEAHTQFSGY